MEKNQKWPRDRPTTDSRESPPPVPQPVQQPVPQPHGSDLEALRNMILRTFPSFIYSGTVVAGGDHGPWTEAIHDEDLYRTLKLQRWTDIPPGFIERHPGDFVLLTAPALAAFLPAWLIFSLDNSYQATEFVAHTFAPQDPQDPHGP